MKLYLASKHVQFPNELVDLVGKEKGEISAFLVVNAFDNYPKDRREMHVGNLKTSLEATGVKAVDLDLRDYFERKDELKDLLDSADLLWISGGNLFYLRYVLRKCGLESYLGDLIGSGMTYGGDSAGAAVIGPDMHGLDLLDDPAEAPELIYEGLGIIPFIILPHWGNERYQNEIEDCKKMLDQHNESVVTINDDQVYVVNGDTEKTLGR